MEKNLLVAFDDSENALRAVEFVAQWFAPDSRVTLFNVVTDTEALCEMNCPELTPYFKAQQSSFCSLEEKKRSLVETALEKAVTVLRSAGFAKEQIVVKMEVKKNGIARDVVREANSGYDVLVVGRRGASGIKEFILGSIAQKIFQLAQDVSVVIVN